MVGVNPAVEPTLWVQSAWRGDVSFAQLQQSSLLARTTTFPTNSNSKKTTPPRKNKSNPTTSTASTKMNRSHHRPDDICSSPTPTNNTKKKSVGTASRSTMTTTSYEGITGMVGVFVVYGSWNVPSTKLTKTRTSNLQHWMDGLLHPVSRPDTRYVLGTIQVDTDDDELTRCCGDDDSDDDDDGISSTARKKNGTDGSSTTKKSHEEEGSSSTVPSVEKNTAKKNTTPQKKLPCPPGQLPALLLVMKRTSMKEPEVVYLTKPKPQQILQHWKDPFTTMDIQTVTEVHNQLQSFGLLLQQQHPSSSASGVSVSEYGTSPLKSPSAGIGTTSTTRRTITSGGVTAATPTATLTDNDDDAAIAVRIFIGGDRMSVGKTSVCLGLLGSLVRRGYPTESLAYIKPATQNESPQLVQKYCERMGIACIPIGPVVYYRGFTRAFLAGETDTSDELLQQVATEVDELAKGKRVVVVDGVGFPAVGSICGTDNAHVARASGYPASTNQQQQGLVDDVSTRHPPGVVLVGGSGVGGAVDAFNLNASYFAATGVPVLGAIFNKLSKDGYYSLDNCKAQISSYFAQNPLQQLLGRQAFGFVPLYAGIANEDDAMDNVHEYVRLFEKHVDMERLLKAAQKIRDRAVSVMDHDEIMEDVAAHPTTSSAAVRASSIPDDVSNNRPSKRRRPQGKSHSSSSRAAIEMAAIRAGAAPSA